MIVVDWPLMLLLVPLPWLIRRWVSAAQSTRASLRIPFFERIEPLLTRQHQPKIGSKQRTSAVMMWFLLILAASRPQYIGDWQQLPVSGRDLVMAVDISASMNFPDLGGDNQQSRLALVKQLGGDFITRRQGDRLGLVLFAGSAHWQTPLTFDHRAVKHLLSEAEIGLAGRETALGDAIGLVVKQLQDLTPAKRLNPADHGETAANKVLILLTDGASNSGRLDPLEAARMAAIAKLKIYTLGLGADKMLARTDRGVGEINPSRDLDEKLLKQIARITGGRYFRARDRSDLAALYRQLDRLEPSVSTSRSFRPTIELYSWPLALALLVSVYLVLGYLSIGLPLSITAKGSKKRG